MPVQKKIYFVRGRVRCIPKKENIAHGAIFYVVDRTDRFWNQLITELRHLAMVVA